MAQYNILITGKDSHIGNKIQEWLLSKQTNDIFYIHQLDVITDDWVNFDFNGYNVIIHVAAIVHKHCEDWNLYKRVNVELPVRIAKKAKDCGVSQFVFFSSMAVYGLEKILTKEVIDEDTIPRPKGYYGLSKYLAEQELMNLSDNSFKIAIVRPPNVYGENNTRGYIITFAKMIKRFPVLPIVYEDVRQSMIFIDNLTELIYLIIINKASGYFMPQDDEPISTVTLISAISEAKGVHIYKSKILGVIVSWFSFIPLITKAYGGISYKTSISKFEHMDYVIMPFKKAIKKALVDYSK